MPSDDLKRAIELAKSGKQFEARGLLYSLLEKEPKNIAAWIWYANTWQDISRKIRALELGLIANPDAPTIRQAISELNYFLKTSQDTLKSNQAALESSIDSLKPIQDTKKCPYCAETIKAEAIVCRYCGRELGAIPIQAGPVTTPVIPQPSLVDAGVETLVREGWQVVNRTPTAAQLKKPKNWNGGCLVLFVVVPLLGGLLYPPLFGVAIVALLLVVVQYMMDSDQMTYLSEDKLQLHQQELAEKLRQKKAEEREKAEDRNAQQRKREVARQEREAARMEKALQKDAGQVTNTTDKILGMTSQQLWILVGIVIGGVIVVGVAFYLTSIALQ